jgi:DNA topoisomerase-1
MKLAIVESPSKAKTIKGYLGDDFEVEASVGHLRDLPKSADGAIDIEAGFVPHYVIPERQKKLVKKLKKKYKEADEVILATDPDREGEAIAWHVGEVLGLDYDSPKVKRITFNEITKEAVQAALKNARKIDTDLRHAQEARRVLDRIFGYDLSELIWKKVRYGLSAGRVQSPALRIIMERERLIRAFEPEDYWVISADVKAAKDELTVVCDDEPRDEDRAKEIVAAGEKHDWVVADVEESNRKRNPRAPFKTSTLQRAGSTRLNFSPSRTMRAAQKLYEAGHITYMRTDSTTLSESAQKQILAWLSDNYDDKYQRAKQYKTKSKSAQEAHEAIRPTTVAKNEVKASKDAKKLYDLIWRRTVASQMTPAKLKRTRIITRIIDDSVGDMRQSVRTMHETVAGSRQQEKTLPNFTVSGTRTIFDGWLAVHPAARGEDVELPEVSPGDELNLQEISSEAKETQPPGRYSEAGLIKELEERGIGRPSTYATIINTLENRGYVNKDGRTLYPTDTGDVVSSFLEEHFEKYVSDDFTSNLEDQLDQIAGGEAEYEKTLTDFYGPFEKQLKSKEDIDKITTLGPAPNDEKCPECESDMVIKLGRAGKFLSCERFPDCEGARTMDGEAIADTPLGVHPEEEKNIYIKSGPYGPYIQLGEDDDKGKPKRVSIPDDQETDDIDMELALKYLSVPRELGEHPETGKKVIASIGPYGPYVKHDGNFQSLKKYDKVNVYDVTLEKAVDVIADGKKKSKKKGKKKKKK